MKEGDSIDKAPTDQKFPSSSSGEKLRLYGLFKQATKGNCTGPKPSVTEPVARAKYEAWVACEDLTKEEAQAEYNALVKQIDSSNGGSKDSSTSVLSNKLKSYVKFNNRRTTKSSLNSTLTDSLSREGVNELICELRLTRMFSHLKEKDLLNMISQMERLEFKQGEQIGPSQGDETCAIYIITKGQVEKIHDGNVYEIIGEDQFVFSIGTLHALSKCPSFATNIACSDHVVVWKLSSEKFSQCFNSPRFGRAIATGLSAEIRLMTSMYGTPLLEQPPQIVNIAAVSVAASFEAYYRSMMNALMNANLAKQTSVKYFPDMHLQIPTRVFYINGFKATRQWLSDQITIEDSAPEWERQSKLISMAVMPGVFMTPVSGFLEAFNAKQSNPEPLWRRSTRGILPRCIREVIFGVGLNQLSDFCEERVPESVATNKVLRTAIGSVAAGLVAGYFSHIPHNLSTMKLLEPTVSYKDHFSYFVERSKNRLPYGIPESAMMPLAVMRAIFLPQAIAIRSTQIIGSFVILNGVTHLMDIRNWGSQQK